MILSRDPAGGATAGGRRHVTVSNFVRAIERCQLILVTLFHLFLRTCNMTCCVRIRATPLPLSRVEAVTVAKLLLKRSNASGGDNGNNKLQQTSEEEGESAAAGGVDVCVVDLAHLDSIRTGNFLL